MSRVFGKTKLFYDKIRIRLENGEEVLLVKTKRDNDLTEIKLHLSNLPNLLIEEVYSKNKGAALHIERKTTFIGYKLKLGEEVQKEPLTELEKCKKDINYFTENYCTRSDGSAIELTEMQKTVNTLVFKENAEILGISRGRKFDAIIYKK